MNAMEQIEKLTKNYAEARTVLADRVSSFDTEQRELRTRHLRGIRAAVAKAVEHKDVLEGALKESKELFTKKKTQIFHGIRVGFQKGKGKIVFADLDEVVRLIEKHFPQQLKTLLKVTKKPIKKALGNLSADDLKKLGVTVNEAGDAVFIEPVDGEVDKVVEALLGAGNEPDPEEDD